MAAGQKTGGRKAGTPNKRKLSPRARQQVDDYMKRTEDAPSVVSLKVNDAGALDINHPDDDASLALLEALKLTYGPQLAQYLRQIAIGHRDEGEKIQVRPINEMLQTIVAMGPRDTVEAMLCAQMASVHDVMMTVTANARMAKNIMQADSATNAMSKLSRTFTAQVEALTRYRTRGQQKMVIEHLHAHAGSQVAVIGQQGGGGDNGKVNQPHGRTDISERSPMLSHSETLETPLPLPGSDGLERMPVARSEGRGAHGDA